jgi:CheY-like chemotaxis protein
MRLLIVEDEARMATALQRGLIAEGFTVEVALNGPDGLHLARENTYDAIICDIMLPGLSGYRIIEALRAEQNWVPVLVLSAKDGEYDEADALDLGADDYLIKPFSFVVLLARLRAVLRRGVRPRPAILACGDLTLDPAARAVHRGDTEIELTPREFSLLPDAPGGRRGQQGRHPAPRLGRPLRGRRERHRGLCRLPPSQDRPAFQSARGTDCAGRGLPAGHRRWVSVKTPRRGGAGGPCGRASLWSRPRCSRSP